MSPFVVLDTSQPFATVAVVDGAQVLGAVVLSEQKRHAESLVDALDRALLAAGLDLPGIAGVAVGRGPGSFIGIRTGIAFAKGLAIGRGVPLIGLPSLLAVAASATPPRGMAEGMAEGTQDGTVEGLVVVDAKRGEVFVQRVRWALDGVSAAGAPAALTLDAARALTAGERFYAGNADLSVDAAWQHVTGASATGLARTLRARIGEGVPPDETEALVPDYGREADAKLPAIDPGARRTALLGP